MDRSADFVMPSPKRIRLEASEPDPAFGPATVIDDMDDLYGTPPVQLHGPTKDSHVLAPALCNISSPIEQKPFQLPGLGMFNGDSAYALETPPQHSQPYVSFSEIQQSSSTEKLKDMEQEDEHELQVNGELNTAVDDKLFAHDGAAGPANVSPIAGEIVAEGNATGTATSEERVSNAEVPINQDVTRSGFALERPALEWHSSGTVFDNGGNHWLINVPSTAPEPNNIEGGTHEQVPQENDSGLDGDNAQGKLFLRQNSVAEQSAKDILTKPTFEEPVEANKDNEEAEFELDSSPLGSESCSDESTDTTSSDDSDADDYEMLSPAEQARRLMAEDGGSDNDGKGKGRNIIAEVPRTLNEKPDELVPKPTVVITEDMKIEELGLVENTIENLALIKANTSGEYQVLESGSLLCLQDRNVIGVVSETLGRVQQPYYSVRFTNSTAIAEAGIEKGTKCFYVVQHSTTVFTQPLKAFKGSDASNLHDEEVGDDELEFSDDEAEAEHRRQIKQHRMAKRSAREGQPDGFSRGPEHRPGGPGARLSGGLHPVQEHPPNGAEAALNYDDVDGLNANNKEDEDGLYTPLKRPSNLHEILSGSAPPMNNHASRGNATRGRGDGRGANRGRGDSRGRGGNRGMRISERGGKQIHKDQGNRGGTRQPHGHPSPPKPQTNGFSPSQPNVLPPRPRPETIGYQRSTHQGNNFPHPPPRHSPIPSPAFQPQQQFPTYTHSVPPPPQYPTAYNQPYFQQPQQPPHPYNFPQQNQPQYYQPQGYVQQFAPQPDMSISPRPQQYPPSIPPGAHINPNLFKQQGQPPSPQGWQQSYNQPQQQQQQAYSAGNNNTGPANGAMLHDLLRDLGGAGG